MQRGTATAVVAEAVRRPFHQSGGAGWVLLAGLVVTWDATAPETMSAAFRRACSTPGGKAVVVAGWTVLTAHLLSVLPERADPLMLLVKVARSYRTARECAAI